MRKLVRFLLGFLDPRIPVLFVVGAVLLEVISSALYECIREGMGSPLWVLGLLAATFCLFVVVAGLLTLVLGRLKPRVAPSVPGEPARRRKGLIALVSYGRLSHIPATPAVEYHLGDSHGGEPGPLRHCWLIATKPPDEEVSGTTTEVAMGISERAQPSASNALDLAERYAEQPDTIEVITIADADDPEETFVAVEEANRRARKNQGLRSREVIADFMRGTRSMSVGMVLACAGPDRHLQYMKPRKYMPDGRADRKAGSEARSVDIDFFLRAGQHAGEEEG